MENKYTKLIEDLRRKYSHTIYNGANAIEELLEKNNKLKQALERVLKEGTETETETGIGMHREKSDAVINAEKILKENCE